MLKLGQKVRFKKEFVKGFHLTKEEQALGIQYGVLKHETEKEGIIAGVRNIGYKGYWDCDTGEYGQSYGTWWNVEETKKVYLIATNLRGFHRVPEEFIEVI